MAKSSLFPSLLVRLAAVSIVLLVASSARAQVRWQIVGATGNIIGDCESNETGISGPLTSAVESCAVGGAFQPSVPGSGGIVHEYGLKCFREAKEEVIPPAGPPPLWVQTVIKGRAFIDGDNTDEITVEWLNLSYCDQFTDGHIADSRNRLSFDIDLRITNGPVNAPVLVYYYWDAFGGASTAHDCPQNPLHPNCVGVLEEDAVLTNNALIVGGRELLGGRFDFASPGGVPGWNVKNNQGGAIAANVGDTIRISLNSHVESHLLSPEPQLYKVGPESDAIFKGTLRITVGYIPPPLPPAPPEPFAEFSVDIGGDAELSDPNRNGNEAFDPGDTYQWGGPPLPPCGASGIRDDSNIFAGVDVSPSAPDCFLASAAPVCAGPFQPHAWFDLDGTDSLDFSLIPLLGPQPGPIAYFPSDCIYSAEHLAVSFHDDSAVNYADPAFCSVPVNAVSPYSGQTFGTGAKRDEVYYLNLDDDTATTTAALAFASPIADERTVHRSLAPNPDLSDAQDDDVDALDMVEDAAICTVWYISPDHEAAGVHPNFGFVLDPGDIYEVANGVPNLVVSHALHLGLIDGVDIDAFEFIWLYHETDNAVRLALLFSVDDDDPFTPPDESAGLDPTTIYVSFLDGRTFQYLTTPLGEDVDAIATWRSSLVAPTRGACCFGAAGCQELDPQTCVNNGGEFGGLGTDCADVNQNGEPDACECTGCRGDLNGDLSIDGQDTQAFIQCLVGAAANCGCADIDGDAQLDLDDLQLFVHALLYGPLQPCP